MSVDNSELLMLLGVGKKAKQTIGVAGQQGFGVGVYGGDLADLTAMGLTPMKGCNDPASDNYGNYIHANGSIMVFIPAFCYRLGKSSAPSYYRDGTNAIEIRDALEMGMQVGSTDYNWIPKENFVLHRAFIDGGRLKSGFFIDKYICSKDSTGDVAISVKNGNNISLSSSRVNSSSMPGCSGELTDAIVLGRARGVHYSATTVFQWSALALLSLAHGQAATSSQWCGWYDSNYRINYPKGNTNQLKDFDDSSVVWAPHFAIKTVGKTGSGQPFNKTTHNGQVCGVTDVSGSQLQIALGIKEHKQRNFWILNEKASANDITISNYVESNLFNNISLDFSDNNYYYWGNNSLRSTSTGINRSLCGVLPQTIYSTSLDLFGGDAVNLSAYSKSLFAVGGRSADYTRAGIWSRFGLDVTFSYYDEVGFRVSGYAK